MATVHSAGIIPVRQTPNGWEVLILRKGRYYDSPKGRLDDGEEWFDAALRETAEESNLTDISFPWGRDYHETEPYATRQGKKKKNKIVRYFLGQVMSGEAAIIPNPETGRREHDDFGWYSWKEAARLDLTDRIRASLEWAQERMKGSA